MEQARSPADRAILVFGAAVWAGGRPSPTLARRTRHAARLWHDGAGRVVVPCGGSGRHPPAEAQVMRDILIAEGVSASAIHPETGSTTTAENIALALPILARLGIREVVAVSDAYHLPRVRLLARRAGLRVTVSAPPWRSALLRAQLKGALREVPAYAVALLGLGR